MKNDSKTNYCYDFDIYTGKSDSRDKNVTLGHSIVSKFTETLGPMQHEIYFDRFFSSLPLFDLLSSRGIGFVCTISTHRKEFPKELKDGKLEKGEWKYFSKGKTTILRWKDSKEVFFASNCTDPSVEGNL